jgi:hypothetical protein
MKTANLYLLALAAVALAAPAPAHAAIDGKVAGLNAATYAALKDIKARNPGALTEKSAQEIAAAIRKDGKVDAAETDLLEEMTQSMFRSITITPAGAVAGSTEKVVSYPISGNAKRVLQNVLNPPADLAAEWAKPNHGWNIIVADYKKNPERAAKVLAFVTEEMAKKWAVSNQANGYKPLRDQLGKLYGLSNSMGADTNAGRELLYKAMNIVDRNAQDAVPDFLYNWVRPGGYM